VGHRPPPRTVDEALGGEDPGDPSFIFEDGIDTWSWPDGHRVADAGEHVGDGIGHHDYHDAFLTPGSSPDDASCRTQIRHMPKSRR
jgi:hypothetical protein